MGKAPCCDKHGVRRGAWTPEEDQALADYINKHGHGSWRTLPKHAGILCNFSHTYSLFLCLCFLFLSFFFLSRNFWNILKVEKNHCSMVFMI